MITKFKLYENSNWIPEIDDNFNIVLSINNNNSFWTYIYNSIRHGLLEKYLNLNDKITCKLNWSYLSLENVKDIEVGDYIGMDETAKILRELFKNNDNDNLNTFFNLLISQNLIETRPTISIKGIDGWSAERKHENYIHYNLNPHGDKYDKQLDEILLDVQTKKFNL